MISGSDDMVGVKIPKIDFHSFDMGSKMLREVVQRTGRGGEAREETTRVGGGGQWSTVLTLY